MDQLPRWWHRRGQYDQFDDYSREEITEFNPHELMENEIPAYTRAIRRTYGEAAFRLMTESSLPPEAEEWLCESENGDRMYSFLQNLHDNPFALESETDSEYSDDSGNDTEDDIDMEDDIDNGSGNGNDDEPENPHPLPPIAKN